MTACFLAVLNMSISASWIVLVVLFLRLLLKKAPKWIAVLLWSIVAVRLICPFSIESVLSLMPSAETISLEIMMDQTPQVYTGIPSVNDIINPIIRASFTPTPAASANPLQIWIPILAVVWIAGMVACLGYAVISYWRVKRKISTAVLLRETIFQSEQVVSPFVLGIIKPKIYVPFHMGAQDLDYVIAHEQAHIRRKDHLWKPLGFLILSLHWFNPLMWVGYVLLCRDIELACDEKVIKQLNAAEKADYSQALLTCSVNRRTIAACPLAFGEVGVKDRVKSVLNYKKPAFALIVLAIVASIAVAVCFLTNPGLSLNKEMHTFIEEQILEHHRGHYKTGEFYCADFKVLGTKKGADHLTVYMLVLYQEYDQSNGEIKRVSGAYSPTAITLKKGGPDTQYELAEYWEPRDGSLYPKDIVSKFPWYLLAQAFSTDRYVAKQQEACDKAAEKYFSSISNTGGADGPENVIVSANPIIDTATFDLDGDGRAEQCTLRCGPTSGVFTFIFSASENGVLEYFNLFHSPVMKLRFEKNAEGQTVLVGTQGEHTRYMVMYVDNGNIVIASDEQDLVYWGLQGITSPFAPAQ